MNSKQLEGLMDFEFLTEQERKNLEMVLNRNNKLNQKENERLRRLSTNSANQATNLKENRSNSQSMQENLNVKSSPTLSVNIIGNCSSCGRKFSVLPWSCASSNSNLCALCKMKMCKKCTHRLDRPNIQICKSCHKSVLFEAKSGKWFFNNRELSEHTTFDSDTHQLNKEKWNSLDKINSLKLEYGSVDNLETQSISSQAPLIVKHSVSKKRSDNIFQFDSSSTRNTSSPDTFEGFISPFRRVKSATNKGTNLVVNNLDATVKSEDSGCALDMDEETTSEVTLKTVSNQSVSQSKCYFRPLQVINQNSPLDSTEVVCQRFSPMDHGRLDNSMSDSISSLFTLNSSAGEVLLSLLYDDNNSTLNLTIHKCRNLVNADMVICCINPYIIVYLKPNKKKYKKQRTRTHFNNNNPNFEEYFLIPIDIDCFETLVLLLCHKNEKTGKDLAVGQLLLVPEDIINFDIMNKWFSFIKLNSVKTSNVSDARPKPQNIPVDYKAPNINLSSPLSDQLSSSSSNEWKNLGFSASGEITLALKFVSHPYVRNQKVFGELQIWIKSCRIYEESCLEEINKSSKSSENEGHSSKPRQRSRSGSWFSEFLGYHDPIAKAHLFTVQGVIGKEIASTKFVDTGGYYIWSSILKFDTDIYELNSSTLEISIWINSNSFLNKLFAPRCIGSITLTKANESQKSLSERHFPNRSPSEHRLWQAMLTKHNIWIDESMVLRRRKT